MSTAFQRWKIFWNILYNVEMLGTNVSTHFWLVQLWRSKTIVKHPISAHPPRTSLSLSRLSIYTQYIAKESWISLYTQTHACTCTHCKSGNPNKNFIIKLIESNEKTKHEWMIVKQLIFYFIISYFSLTHSHSHTFITSFPSNTRNSSEWISFASKCEIYISLLCWYVLVFSI